ncbi:MAG: cupin domain-containing protein [Solirubrobacteraceae bacterium]
MSRLDVPDPDRPPPPVAERVVRCLAVDLEATRRVGGHASAGPAESGRGYLDRLIYKPWGSEFRVYEDDLADVWCLHVRAGHRTSLHCHLRKRTALLCLDGRGTLSTLGGVQHALRPGVVLHIEPGAYHRTTADARSNLRLVEIETPKDKFDLLRIEDDYRSVDEPYEGEDHAALRLLDHDAAPGAPLALQPFVEQRLAGDRQARLRAQGSTTPHRFAVETGEQIRTSTTPVFAIALESRAMPPP